MSSRQERRKAERDAGKTTGKRDTSMIDPAVTEQMGRALRTAHAQGVTPLSALGESAASDALTPLLGGIASTIAQVNASTEAGMSERDAASRMLGDLLRGLTGASGKAMIDVGRLRDALPDPIKADFKTLTQGASRMKLKDVKAALETLLLGKGPST